MFAQNDSILCEMPDTTFNNTIKDTIVLKYSRGIVPFETITREGTKYYAVTSDGHKEEITSFINGRKRVMVKDGNGHELVIDKDGNVMGVEEYKKCGGSKALLRENIKEKDSQVTRSGNVKFLSAGDYLFDTYDNYSGKTGYAERFPSIGEGDYKPAYACVESNTKLEIKAEPYANITFKNERGVPLICKGGILEVTARGDRDTTSIYAYDADNHIVGKVNVLSYDKVTRKICLVPIGDTKAPDASTVKQGLDEIFAKLMVDFDVTIGEPITIQYAKNNIFTHGGSGVIGVYNADQKAAIAKLKERGVDEETAYLFLVEKSNALNDNDDKDYVSGYMPRGYQFGFIYHQVGDVRTIAHELCHGAFHLKHTFDATDYLAPEKATDNLMDYNHGKTLNHWQWKDIHQPKSVRFKWLQDEEGSEFVTNEVNNEEIIRAFREINCAYKNGKYKVTLYFPRAYGSSIKLNELAQKLNSKRFLNDDSFVLIELPQGMPVFTNDYVEDEYPLSTIEVGQQSISLVGNQYGRITISCATPDAVKVLLIDSDLGISEISDLNALQLASTCDLVKISLENRKNYLAQISNSKNGYNSSIPDRFQKVAINLLRTTPDADKSELLSFLSSPELIRKLYEGIDDYRSDFVSSLLDIYVKYKNSIKYKTIAQGLIPQTTVTPAQMLVDRLWGINSKTETLFDIGSDNKIHITIDKYRGWHGVIDYVKNAINDDREKFEGEFFDVINYVIDDDESVEMPLFYLAFLSQVEQKETSIDNTIAMLKGPVNMALLASGLKEIQGASAILKSDITAQNVARLILASADFASLGLGEYCENENSEFCQAYKKYELYINLGLLSANILNEFPEIINGLRIGLNDTRLSSKQKEELEKILGTSSPKAAKVADHLTGELRKTFDELTTIFEELKNKGKSVKYTDDGSTIKFFNGNNDIILEIANGKFTVKKWGAHYLGTVEKELDNGYWLVKNSDGSYSIDLGFKEGRKLTGEEVNEYYMETGRSTPYTDDCIVTEEVLKPGKEFYMVIDGFKVKNGVKVVNNKPGGWGSNDAITTIKELREDMAVLESWKKLEYEPTRVKYRVTKELPVRNGVVGPQIDSYAEETIYFDIFVSYKDGNQQYELILPKGWTDEKNPQWINYLDEVERTILE